MGVDKDLLALFGTLVVAGGAGIGELIRRARRRRKEPPAPPQPSRRVYLPTDDGIDFQAIFEEAPCACLVLSPALFIVGVSNAYLRATMTTRESILRRHIFEVFPDNQDDLGADGVANLRASLERVLTDMRRDEMKIQRYDIRRWDSQFEARYWKPTNVPVHGADGRVRYIIHHVIDVTESMRSRPPHGPTFHGG